MSCPVCKSKSITSHIRDFEYAGKPYSLSECRDCGCWFYDPFPTPDYVDGLTSEMSIRHYLETCAGIESLATISENFVSIYAPGAKKGLEIGCGFGFVSHYLEQIHKQEMTAYEPSDYGAQGKKILGLNIIRDFFKSDGNGVYDFCISTEVIEHIEDPVSFAADIHKSLQRDGVLLLSTPDKDAIRTDVMEPIDLALLSPGMHTILFSEKSLKKMLSLAGYRNVIVKRQGATLYAIASDRTISDKDIFKTDFRKIINYYTHLYTTAEQDSPLQKGIFYRLFRLYVDFGMYAEAVALLQDNTRFYVLTEEDIRSIQTEMDLKRYYSLTDSIIYFYCGILYLNHLKNYEKAAHFFMLSFISCSKRLNIVAQFSIVDADIIWQAKFHQGMAYEMLKDPAKASAAYLQLLTAKKGLDKLPAVNETLYKRAKDKLREVIEMF